MPSIKNYAIDNSINDDDLILGSDSADSNKTKTFRMADIKAYILPSGGALGQVLKSDGNGGTYWE